KDAAAVRTHLPDENEAVRRDDYREFQHLAAQTYLDRLCKDQGGNGLRVSAEVVGGGDAAPVLEALAGGIDNGLMVLAAHGESGSTSSPYGSTVLHALVYGGTTLLVVQDRDRDELAES